MTLDEKMKKYGLGQKPSAPALASGLAPSHAARRAVRIGTVLGQLGPASATRRLRPPSAVRRRTKSGTSLSLKFVAGRDAKGSGRA
jgi:hypothetical protein